MKSQQLLNWIDRLTEEFVQSFKDLNEEEMNWKPSPAVWSIGQNLEHLIQLNESFFPLVASAMRKNYQPPFHARWVFLVRYLEKALLRSVEPERKKKIKTFEMWKPKGEVVEVDILERFTKHQKSLKQMVRNSRGLLENEIVISSPANRYIVYRLEVAYEILLTHEERHLNQTQDLKVLMDQTEKGF